MKKILIVLIVLFIVSGCGDGGDGGTAPGISGTAPVIDDVVLTDEYFNIKFLFNIGDLANFLVYANDPDMDMETLFVTEFYPNDSTTPYTGPTPLFLPSQSEIDMVYFMIESVAVLGPAGNWRIEFQIEDYAGHASNIFRVFFIVQ